MSRHGASFAARRLTDLLKAAGPPLLFGLRLWASVSLALYVAFWLELDNPVWAGTSAAIVCQPHLGASLRKGWYRMIGTLVGAVAIVVLTACFPQDRVLFLGALALWGGASALAATLLRNFAAYAVALAGYTAAIVGGDLLGATGGVNADAAFLLAVSRGSEIIIGIVCAGIVLAATDLGDAPRRLAALFAAIASGIADRFTGTLTVAGANFDDIQRVRWEFVRRVIALDPVIDEAIGESAQLRYHSPVLQRAVDGLFTGLVGWRSVANHLVRLSDEEARRGATVVLESVPRQSSTLLFTTNLRRHVSGYSRSKAALDRHMGIDDWILHDLRRSCATGMAKLNVPPHVVDRILNHVSGSIRGVAAVYNRHSYAEERKVALEAWGRYVENLVRPSSSNVVEMPRRAEV